MILLNNVLCPFTLPFSFFEKRDYNWVKSVVSTLDRRSLLMGWFPFKKSVIKTYVVIQSPDDRKVQKILALENWRDSSSHSIKKNEIEAVWGNGGIPDYLWFAIGDVHYINETQTSQILAQFFKDHEPSFGDIELHYSTIVPDEVALRIRNADILLLEVEIDGTKYPMYQAGHGGGSCVRFCSNPTS